MISQWLSTIGLIIDMIGALLVAYEVVKKFDGTQFVVGTTYDTVTDPPKKTGEYVLWEIRKYKFMSAGLIALLFGFFLQIIAVWTTNTNCVQ